VLDDRSARIEASLFDDVWQQHRAVIVKDAILVVEGLLRYDRQGNLIPGVAERWDIRPSGATFWLRQDSVWSDGKPVTAHDFVFAWRKAVDPATASQYAFIMYPVKNGEAINRGDLPIESLGVRAVSDDVLEVELENPIAYFDKLVGNGTC